MPYDYGNMGRPPMYGFGMGRRSPWGGGNDQQPGSPWGGDNWNGGMTAQPNFKPNLGALGGALPPPAPMPATGGAEPAPMPSPSTPMPMPATGGAEQAPMPAPGGNNDFWSMTHNNGDYNNAGLMGNTGGMMDNAGRMPDTDNGMGMRTDGPDTMPGNDFGRGGPDNGMQPPMPMPNEQQQFGPPQFDFITGTMKRPPLYGFGTPGRRY